MNSYGVNGVMVSVEVPAENLVHEITYDGQELLQTPLSMTESLTRLAHRIDFSGTGIPDTGTEAEKPEDPDEGTFKTLPTWPWDQMRNKLRNALTELCVLSDILQLSQQKKYLVLDPVQAEHPDSRAAVTLLYKKKGLAAASGVLLQGAERLRVALNEAKSKSSVSSLQDFHIELLKLRQNWRLRKIGNTILGDLSYKTAGSRFPQAGLFEVQKAEDDGGQADLLDEIQSGSQPKPTSALRVIVPRELQGTSYIQVLIQKDQDILSMATVGLLCPPPTPHEAQWQQRLEAAQNVLFCRELFSVLAREAVQVNDLPIPPLVVGNQITATLFPNILLIIGLCHGNTGKGSSSFSSTPNKVDHNHVLEHSLHQLLRDVHRRNSCTSMPHPATAPIGVSKKRRLAGPLAYEKQTLLQLGKRETILEEIIHQAQHVVLRLRTMYVLDSLAKDIKDPLIITHWASLNAVTHSCVRINLLSSGYDATIRTPLIIHVKKKSLKCILKDGKAIQLSYEPQELRDVVLSQIAVHQIMVLQSLAKLVGWFVSASSCHLGVGQCEVLGNATGAMLTSPNGKSVIGVRVSPQNPLTGIEVFVQSPPAEVSGNSDTNPGSGPSNLTSYKAVDLEKLDGKNFLNKMEILMAVLTDA